MDKFDECALQSEKDMQASQGSDGFLPSVGGDMALPGALTGAIVDTVTSHFNSDMSSDDAVSKLLENIELARD